MVGRRNILISCAIAAVLQGTSTGVAHGASLIQDNAVAWVAAARTGRADMLILGDSVVNHAGMGWTGGIAHAASRTLGLAGTGMMAVGPSPGRAGGVVKSDAAWTVPASMAHGGLGNLAAHCCVWRADAEQPGHLLIELNRDAELLPLEDPYQWQIWVASDGDGGTLRGARYSRFDAPWQRRWQAGVPATPVIDGFQQITLDLGTRTSDHADWHEFSLQDASEVSIFYHRLIAPERTGITITGWSHSGAPTQDLVRGLYETEQRDREGRAAYLTALVHGNSGKLNVVIAEGINDIREFRPSLTSGILPGSSEAAFADNVMTLVDSVRDDWDHAGFSQEDLSFTLLSNYQVDPARVRPPNWFLMKRYRNALLALAQSDPQLSLIDMWDVGPDWPTASQRGYIHDGLHPSYHGALVYGEVFMAELLAVPEPSGLALIGAVLPCVLAGRRWQRASPATREVRNQRP